MTQVVDWMAAYKKSMEDDLARPPYVMLPGVDPPATHHACGNAYLELLRENRRLYPRLEYWCATHAGEPGWRSVSTDEWPSCTLENFEDLDDLIEKLIEDGTVPDEGAALDYLYEHNPEFRADVDSALAELAEEDKKTNLKHLIGVWHRAACTIKWARIFAGKLWRDQQSSGRKRERD